MENNQPAINLSPEIEAYLNELPEASQEDVSFYKTARCQVELMLGMINNNS